MKMRYCALWVAALVVAVGCSQSSPPPRAAAELAPPKENREIVQVAATVEKPAARPAAIGEKAPAWTSLAGTDDKQHSLKDLADAKAIAVVFTCNTCPVAVAYEDRLEQLAKDYKDKGLALVAINVNKDEKNNLAAMKQRAEEKGITYAYLFDPSQQIGRAYGATCTPHAFLLDHERKVAYMGAIDDDMNAESVKQHSLRDAIDAVLAGKQPEVATTKQFGCGIHYD